MDTDLELEELIKNTKPSLMDQFMISNDEFITLYKQDKLFLLDVRMFFETKVWSVPIATNIPANDIPNRLDELPKDRLIVVTCPTVNRSIPVSLYLKTKGFNSKYLKDGLVNLLGELKGGKAKDLLGI